MYAVGQMRQNPEKEMIEKLPNFLTFVPGQTDFERWKSFKMGQMNGYRTIPESFKNDRILRRRICPIFSTPIRIPAKVRLPNDGEYLCDNNGVPLLFEKIHFLALYSNNVISNLQKTALNGGTSICLFQILGIVHGNFTEMHRMKLNYGSYFLKLIEPRDTNTKKIGHYKADIVVEKSYYKNIL